MFNFKPNGTKHNKNEEKKYYVFFFPTTKIPCGTRWDETRGSSLILENGRLRTSTKKPPKRGKIKWKCWEIRQINQNHINGMSKSGYRRNMFFYMKKGLTKTETEQKSIMQTVHEIWSEGQTDDVNFCVNMKSYECGGLWLSVLASNVRWEKMKVNTGTVPKHTSCCHWIWEDLGLVLDLTQ